MTQLAPSPKFQVCDVAGVPLAGGRVYTYAAGTSTPKDTYLDYSISAANTNPIILDSRGEATIWLNGAYRFVMRDQNDVLIWEEDNIRDLTSSPTFIGATLSGTLTISSTAITWSGNPTHSGNHTFANNVVFNGNVTIGDSTVDSLTVSPSSVTWATSTAHTGNHAFVGTMTGTIGGGTYTPTLASLSNLDSTPTINGVWKWIRVNNVVSVTGSVNMDPTSASAATTFSATLPVASTMTAVTDLAGCGTFSRTSVDAPAYIQADSTFRKADIRHTAVSTSAEVGWFTFSYEVK